MYDANISVLEYIKRGETLRAVRKYKETHDVDLMQAISAVESLKQSIANDKED